MYHSIIFGDKNTYDDWHLIPLNRPTFTMPQAKTEVVEVPGSDYVIDLSEILSDGPVFSNRTGSFSFMIENGKEDFFSLSSRISNYLNGRRMKAILEDDPLFYYEGRFSVASASGARHSQITINYDVAPYKRSLDNGNGQYLWDTFSFIDGVVRDYFEIPIDGTEKTIELLGFDIPVMPEIRVNLTSGEYIVVKTDTGIGYTLTKGTNVISSWKLTKGIHPIKISGLGDAKGTVSILYEERSM